MSIAREFDNDVSMNREPRTPAFQLNKFQSEYNLSFNQEMAKIIAYALQNSEDYLEEKGKNIPPPLFALLSRLEDLQKPKFYKDYVKSKGYVKNFEKSYDKDIDYSNSLEEYMNKNS
jgi:hypothetical protein